MRIRPARSDEFRFSLGWKRILWVVMPILAGAMVTALLAWIVQNQEHHRSLTQRMHLELDGLDRELTFLEMEVERLAGNPIVINALADPKQRTGPLPEFLGRFASRLYARSFVLTDPTGLLVQAHLDPIPDYRELPSLKETLMTGKSASSLDPDRGLFLVSAPVPYAGSIQGIVVCGFALGPVLERHIGSGMERRLLVGGAAVRQGSRLGGAVAISLAVDGRLPLLHRLGVRLEAGSEPAWIARVALPSVGFVLSIGVGVALAVGLLVSRIAARSVEEWSGSTERYGRSGRLRNRAASVTSARSVGVGIPERSVGVGVPERSVEVGVPERSVEVGVPERSAGVETSLPSSGFDVPASGGERGTLVPGVQFVFDAIPVRFFWKDTEGVYRGGNALFARDAGFGRGEDVLGLRDIDMPWKEDVARYRALEHRIFAGEGPSRRVAETRRVASGHLLSIEMTRVSLADADGGIVGLLGIYDERLSALRDGDGLEQRLERQESLLHSLFQILGEAMWEWDLVTGEMRFDGRWREMFGVAAGVVLEADRAAWRERLHPEEGDVVEGLIQVHLSGASDLYASRHRMRHERGYWFEVEERGRISAWDEQGTPLRMICAVSRSRNGTRDESGAPASGTEEGEERQGGGVEESPEGECDPFRGIDRGEGAGSGGGDDGGAVAMDRVDDRVKEVLVIGGGDQSGAPAIEGKRRAEGTWIGMRAFPGVSWPECGGFDPAAGLAHVGGNDSLYRSELVAFYRQHVNLTQRLQDMWGRSRYDRIGREVLAIRQVLFDIGALNLHDQVLALEGALTCMPRRKEAIARYFLPLCQGLDALMTALGQWLDVAGDDGKGMLHRLDAGSRSETVS
ncbi:MAG: PAS domain-containing protein [Magnetococcales bacterium]|nr:PAS domain-containing protein [Magnetococcales bacterium]